MLGKIEGFLPKELQRELESSAIGQRVEELRLRCGQPAMLSGGGTEEMLAFTPGMEQMQEMVTAGRADLVVVPLGSGLTKDQLVSVDELLAAAPVCGAKRMDAMAERDGRPASSPQSSSRS